MANRRPAKPRSKRKIVPGTGASEIVQAPAQMTASQTNTPSQQTSPPINYHELFSLGAVFATARLTPNMASLMICK